MEISSRHDEFIWVRCFDVKTAKEIKPPGGGAHLIFLDPDGVQFLVKKVQKGGVDVVLEALNEANEAYANKEIEWKEAEAAEKDEENKGKLFVYAFVNDKESSAETLKALEDRWVAKDHSRLVFVKVEDKESPLVSKFHVSLWPSIVFADPSRDRSLLKRLPGKSTVRTIKAELKKAFAKMDK
ncbi:MAG: hypothetical protein HY716_03800 [Planctomycetes bacterium]|nr:hypothetical protein [Planctomycetota bacterium]